MSWLLNMIGRFAPYNNVVNYCNLDKEVVKSCPACGASVSEHALAFASLDRYGFPAATMWCRECDLIFVNPRPTIAAYEAFYDKGTYRQLLSAFSGHEDDHLLPQERVLQVASLLKAHVTDNQLSVLNIGGTRADYDLLAANISIGRYVCLNPGESEAGTGYEVVPVTLEAYAPNADMFDVICLFGTLNHLTAPGDAFKKIARMMRSTSVFVFDYKDPLVKMARMTRSIGALQFDHPVYPSLWTLGVMLNSAGLNVHTCHTDNNRLYTVLASREAGLPLPEIFRTRESALIETMQRQTGRVPFRLAVRAFLSFMGWRC